MARKGEGDSRHHKHCGQDKSHYVPSANMIVGGLLLNAIVFDTVRLFFLDHHQYTFSKTGLYGFVCQ